MISLLHSLKSMLNSWHVLGCRFARLSRSGSGNALCRSMCHIWRHDISRTGGLQGRRTNRGRVNTSVGLLLDATDGLLSIRLTLQPGLLLLQRAPGSDLENMTAPAGSTLAMSTRLVVIALSRGHQELLDVRYCTGSRCLAFPDVVAATQPQLCNGSPKDAHRRFLVSCPRHKAGLFRMRRFEYIICRVDVVATMRLSPTGRCVIPIPLPIR